MIAKKLTGRLLLHAQIAMNFSGGHHHEKVYDWRDDHAQNPDFYDDPRTVGIKHVSEYTFPFTAEPTKYIYTHPQEYNQKDLTTNYVGSPAVQYRALLDCPHTDYLNDAAHEYDYESQDLDFQPESFYYQHFRKQGPAWMWWIIGFMPVLYFGNELFFQFWPDVDNWRYQRPPPLDYPNDAETPDTSNFKMFQRPIYKDLHDAGQVYDPWFTIVDGKKVYTKWAGVNEPRQAI